jgi:hypothetical protein
VKEPGEKQLDEVTDTSNAGTAAPVCPKCGGELIERVATKGQYTGQKFWGVFEFSQMQVYQQGRANTGVTVGIKP